jgi:hypothetical protein
MQVRKAVLLCTYLPRVVSASLDKQKLMHRPASQPEEPFVLKKPKASSDEHSKRS